MVESMRSPVLVQIDGVNYRRETELEAEARRLLSEVYGCLWTEAYYDPDSEDTRKFAQPLAEKMSRLNELLKFKR
jgi:hypothetical protein